MPRNGARIQNGNGAAQDWQRGSVRRCRYYCRGGRNGRHDRHIVRLDFCASKFVKKFAESADIGSGPLRYNATE